jgi:hypothetical protein
MIGANKISSNTVSNDFDSSTSATDMDSVRSLVAASLTATMKPPATKKLIPTPSAGLHIEGFDPMATV